jgi:quercetin dioxygenase-like cupin family protein
MMGGENTRLMRAALAIKQPRLSSCQLNRERLTICRKLGPNEPGAEREGVMLSRRAFAGFASCAICGITEFVATEAFAQGAQPTPTTGVTRKILAQSDGPAPGYVTLLVEATIEPGVKVARHTHPGIESAYVLEGGFELPIEGQPTRTIKAGDGFQIPPETPHAGGKPGEVRSRILVTYIVEKGKPLASPA